MSNKAYAQVYETEFKQLPDSYWKNKVEEEGILSNITGGFSDIAKSIKEIPHAIENVFQTLSDVIDWFKDFPEHMTSFTTELTSKLYELITALILKTPLFIFDNPWFENTTYLISIVSIGVVTILTLLEGIKRKFRKKHVDLKTIGKRWFFVAGLSTLVPILFYKAFQFLNFLSDSIINLSSHTIANPLTSSLPAFDLIVLLLFNIVMIALTVPILLKNAKRFFDILTLGIISPLAGVAYIFDPFNHLFKQWWATLKKLSLVQIVYAFYLMIIGLFIYGVPTPPTFEGVIIKLLIVVGGFTRLMTPPNFVQRYLGSDEGIDSVVNDNKKTTKKIKKGLTMAANTIKNPVNAIKYLANPNPVALAKNTRMSRIHKK